MWLADQPLDIHEGAEGDDLLLVEIPEAVIHEYEWVEEGKGYREFCVPAGVVNRYSVRRVSAEDEEAISFEAFRRRAARRGWAMDRKLDASEGPGTDKDDADS